MKKIIYLIFILAAVYSCSKYDGVGGLTPLDNGVTGELSSTEKYTDYGENAYVSTAEQPNSSFAIDADGGSYANMRRFSNYAQKPPKAAVRVEEFLNYFNFDYLEPESGNVSLHTELSSCPWNTEHYLLRIGMKGKKLTELPHSNFVLLIDVSGSMSDPDKLELLKSGFKSFVDKMGSQDRLAIVTYAGSSQVLLQSTYGDKKQDIKAAIDKLGAGGSTAGAQGIITAYDIATQNLIAGGNNRIIIGSDGDFNVGPSSTDELVKLIEEKRNKGIYLTVLGVGQGNFNDAMMEQIANHGNGTYEYIDNAKQLKKVFEYEYSKFFTVAKDAKIQLKFNPETVSQYRLIGYENRVLNDSTFQNDSTDAGEIGANQSITALYELVLSGKKSSDFASIDFRYKMPVSEENIQINYTISNQIIAFDVASENMRFAASVAGLGLLLKESEFKGDLSFEKVYNWASKAHNFDPYGFRAEFLDIVKGYE